MKGAVLPRRNGLNEYYLETTAAAFISIVHLGIPPFQ
jgi:hypothetical protein